MFEMKDAASQDEEGRFLLAEEGLSTDDHEEDNEKAVRYLEEEQIHIKLRLPCWIRSNPLAATIIASVSDWYAALSFKVLFYSFLRFLIPSPFKKASGSDKKEVRDTAWVDGLRGMAAFWVVNSHLASLLVKWTGSGWGHADMGEEIHHEFFMFPFVRLIYSGGFSVYIFFVISGYAISLSPIKRMNQKECNARGALRSLASSAFRRPLRLFLPGFASTLIAFTLIRFRVYESVYPIFESSTVVNGWDSWFHDFPTGDRSFFSQVFDLIEQDMNLLRLLSQPRSLYNMVTWTLAIEFRCSIFLYIIHLGLFCLRRPVRIALACLMTLISIYVDLYYMHLFLVGYIFAEIDQGRTPEQAKARNPLWRSILWALVTVLALWLGSMPEYKPDETPMYVTLGKINPLDLDEPSQAWHRIAAILLFAGLSQERVLRWPFSTALGRYMGRLSFSLYLCHLPILVAVGTLVFNAIMTPIGLDNGFLTVLGFFAAYVVTAIPIWYISDRFEEAVDSRAISFGHKMENLMVRDEFVR